VTSPSDAFRTTLSAAINRAESRSLTAAEIERVVTYLESPGSGSSPGSSAADFARSRLASNPAALAPGQSYVVFGGTDSQGTSNFKNAQEYVAQSNGRAGIIGDTPWGKFVDSADANPDVAVVARKLDAQMKSMGFMVRGGDNVAAVTDMLWNYGSPEFAKNAVLSGNHVVGFLENAPNNRGFTNHELPVLQANDEVRLNGHRIGSVKGDAAEFARKSTGSYLQVEREIADAAGQASGTKVTVADLRSKVDLAYGYEAENDQAFGRSRVEFSRQPIEAMATEADAWSRARALAVGNTHYLTPLQRDPRPAKPAATEPTPHVADGATSKLYLTMADDANSGVRVHSPSPAIKAIGIAGAGALVFDAAQTAKRSEQLDASSNRVGAQSEIIHFGGRNVGGWAGALAGAQAAALLTSETGPGALVGGFVGGVAGAVAGEKIATKIDDYRTYNQQDHTGQSWHMDPAQPDRGWTRTETRIDPNGPTVPGYGFSAPAYKTETITAPPETANELNYKASGVQVQMALAHPPAPRNPYSVEANKTDTPSLREANWQRDPSTHGWHREVTTGYMEHGLPMTRSEIASPERTRELEQSSAQIAEANRTNRPDAIAQRYLDAHREYGWGRFGKPEPAAVEAANPPKNVLQASDGNEYKRSPDGSWKHEGWFGRETPATGNLRDELNEATRSNAIQAPAQKQAEPSNPTQDRIKEMLEAARNGDWDNFRQETQTFAQMQPGQQLQQDAVQQANHIEHQAEQQRAAQVQQQQNDQQQQQAQQQSHGPRMVR
jgi:hypothetical protein